MISLRVMLIVLFKDSDRVTEISRALFGSETGFPHIGAAGLAEFVGALERPTSVSGSTEELINRQPVKIYGGAKNASGKYCTGNDTGKYGTGS